MKRVARPDLDATTQGMAEPRKPRAAVAARQSACADAAARYVDRRFQDETPQQRADFNAQLTALVHAGRLTK